MFYILCFFFQTETATFISFEVYRVYAIEPLCVRLARPRMKIPVFCDRCILIGQRRRRLSAETCIAFVLWIMLMLVP